MANKTMVEDVVLVATVSENMRRLTVREKASALEAEQLGVRLGHMSIGAVIGILNHDVLNCSLTSIDVRNLVAAKGPPIAGIRGKTTKHASAISTAILTPRVV